MKLAKSNELVQDRVLQYINDNRNKRQGGSDQPGWPDPQRITFLGVMSSGYRRVEDWKYYIPVDSVGELFALIPEGSGGLSAQIAFSDPKKGKRAIPHVWSENHQELSLLVYPIIEVLVALLFSRLPNEELSSLPSSLGSVSPPNSSIVIPSDERDLFQWVCDIFSAIHRHYYSDYPGKNDRLNDDIHTSNNLIGVLQEIFGFGTPNEDHFALKTLEILRELCGYWSREWSDGLRMVGQELLAKEDGIFAGTLLPLWEAAVKEGFIENAQRVAANFLYFEERRELDNDD